MCIEWTLEAAARSSRVGRVVVSSDDERAREVAARFGCQVISRPEALASDTARVDDAARHAVLECEERGMLESGAGRDRLPVVILYANVPVRPQGLIDSALALMAETGCDSVQSYQPVGKHHPWWTARVDASGQVSAWEGEVLNHGIFRRQDLPPAFQPDGAVLVVTRQALMLEVPGVAPGPHAFFGKDRRGVINPEGSVVDIDTPLDLLVADAMMRQGA